MSNFVPDGHIICENCYNFFVAYNPLISQIDADAKEDYVKDALKGLINRIKCPFCGAEFTYETSVFIYSLKNRFVITSAYPDMLVDVTAFPIAAKIAAMTDWKFRKCKFFMDAAEKVRIFENGLDDLKIQILKLNAFEFYKEMDLTDQYLIFESLSGDNISFTHRDFTDKVLDNLSVPIREYEAIKCPPAKSGDWVCVDRSYALNFLEVNK